MTRPAALFVIVKSLRELEPASRIGIYFRSTRKKNRPPASIPAQADFLLDNEFASATGEAFKI